MRAALRTDRLEIAYYDHGPKDAPAAILLHGFPDDPRTYDGAIAGLRAAGLRVLVPYLRGYGGTRFLDAATPRSGQQAALAADLRDFMDALGLKSALLAGYDWGGRAACIVAALWPERVRGLVSVNGYAIQDIAAAAATPGHAAQEHRYWYQWYFHTPRGALGLAQNRAALCRLMWQLWSPNMGIDDAAYAATAASFDNADFVAVVLHSYRHRYAQAPGDPAYAAIETTLAARPPITVPTIVLHGAADGVDPVENTRGHARFFTGFYRREEIPVAGHFLPREAPARIVDALLELHAKT
ncbi:MAG: alpha/beta hydrolase [Rhodospirillales bacterium]|nr:alpha/beta hydrolase [Rhodospirillales bacterium]